MAGWPVQFVFPLFLIIHMTIGCDLPSSMWCDNVEIAKKCNAVDACAKFNQSVFGKPIKLTLLYETLCPDCQGFIGDTLYPGIYKYLQEVVDLELVPYGNAKRTKSVNGTFDITCQHGEVECSMNKLHSCVMHQLSDTNRWMPYINCMESALRSRVDPEKAVEACFNKTKIKDPDRSAIKQCRNGPLGDQLQMAMADRTEGIWPEKHTFVPWVLINNASTLNMQANQNNLMNLICAWYRGAKRPGGCEFVDMLQEINRKV